VASVALLAEGRAAVAAAHRGGRIDDLGYVDAVATFERLWAEMEGIELTETLARRAGVLAESHALRGYDAIHLASAEAILDDGDVMVVSDTRLAEAAASIGIEALLPTES
jgi:predicted nucleic acid-binding protein